MSTQHRAPLKGVAAQACVSQRWLESCPAVQVMWWPRALIFLKEEGAMQKTPRNSLVLIPLTVEPVWDSW